MSTTTTCKMTKQRAKALDQEIREALVLTAEKVSEFILGKAWTHLGYESLQDWVKSLSDIRLGLPVVNLLAYELIASGEADDEIALSLRGVGPEGVANLRRQKAAGVPPNLASSSRGLMNRSRPHQIITVVNWNSRDEREAAAAEAEAAGMSLPEFLRHLALETAAADAV